MLIDTIDIKEFDEIEPFQVSSADAPIKMPKPDEKNNIKLASRRTGSFKGYLEIRRIFFLTNNFNVQKIFYFIIPKIRTKKTSTFNPKHR